MTCSPAVPLPRTGARLLHRHHRPSRGVSYADATFLHPSPLSVRLLYRRLWRAASHFFDDMGRHFLRAETRDAFRAHRDEIFRAINEERMLEWRRNRDLAEIKRVIETNPRSPHKPSLAAIEAASGTSDAEPSPITSLESEPSMTLSTPVRRLIHRRWNAAKAELACIERANAGELADIERILIASYGFTHDTHSIINKIHNTRTRLAIAPHLRLSSPLHQFHPIHQYLIRYATGSVSDVSDWLFVYRAIIAARFDSLPGALRSCYAKLLQPPHPTPKNKKGATAPSRSGASCSSCDTTTGAGMVRRSPTIIDAR